MNTNSTPSAARVDGIVMPWRCFHCDQTFTDRDEAALHFGDSPFEETACGVDASELRTLQRELALYHEEDTVRDREIRRLHSEIARRERRAEEDGYAKGLEDARKHPETLGLREA